MSNWKNVNNWHWTSKNCLSWSKEYLKEKLTNLTVENNGINVQTNDLIECSGDAELNQRKGKLIPIIDLMLELTWSGNIPDGIEAKGTIKIPELEAGSEEDCQFEITVEEENDTKIPIKKIVREHLVPLLKENLKNLGKDMVETHSKDVKIESSQLGPATPPRAVTPIDPAQISIPPRSVTPVALGSDVGKSATPNIVNTTSITEIVELQTSAEQVYETLFDPGRVAAWTRSRPDIFRHIGSTFSLFEGNVTGNILELVPNEKIVQTWRLKTWPEGHFSTVTMRFEQTTDYTRVHITQEGVPVGEVDSVRNNWQSYYWNPIKSVFGYGSISSIPQNSKPRKNKNKRGSGEKNNSSGGGGNGSIVFTVAIVLTAIVLGYAFLSRSSNM